MGRRALCAPPSSLTYHRCWGTNDPLHTRMACFSAGNRCRRSLRKGASGSERLPLCMDPSRCTLLSGGYDDLSECDAIFVYQIFHLNYILEKDLSYSNIRYKNYNLFWEEFLLKKVFFTSTLFYCQANFLPYVSAVKRGFKL
ncbi:hypothetical protein OPV22_005370 [Ensete ventricosum]|uniref:Uncharacterized protein n=1 Tax=Ensete ventricosum TaxID=4639 RepID=A0AAV8RQV8_ENSVE|nr:hypothetical protein OPV22_005370 [Ensete ventricosum]